MPLTVIVVRDAEQMSEEAASLVIARLAALEADRSRCVLGLATGGSPIGLYRRLAAAANSGRLDPGCWESFNLDEYVGLPGAFPEARAGHPESYHRFMADHFFGLLERPLRSTAVPPGHLVEIGRLREELAAHPADWTALGSVSGKALVIRERPESAYLGWIRTEILEAWSQAVAAAGGVDLQILGVGGRGHVAFHEAGIPFELTGLLLVRLDAVTRAHAVEDGHFAALEDTPEFALTMSLDLAFRARSVVVLASGARKREAISRSILDKASPEVPMSYVQLYADRGGEAVLVVDAVAAADLLAHRDRIERRGFEFQDRR